MKRCGDRITEHRSRSKVPSIGSKGTPQSLEHIGVALGYYWNTGALNLRRLNLIGQGLDSIEGALEDIRIESPENQRSVLCALAMMCNQAGATNADHTSAASRAGLPAQYRPSCIKIDQECLGLNGFTGYVYHNEIDFVFRYLMALFQLVDERRRMECGADCGHWWHDLGVKQRV